MDLIHPYFWNKWTNATEKLWLIFISVSLIFRPPTFLFFFFCIYMLYREFYQLRWISFQDFNIYFFVCGNKKDGRSLTHTTPKTTCFAFYQTFFVFERKKTDNVIYLALIDTILPGYCRLLLLGKTTKWIYFLYCLNYF